MISIIDFWNQYTLKLFKKKKTKLNCQMEQIASLNIHMMMPTRY